jgi:hypothetical protein
MATEFSEKASDALDAGLEALTQTNSKLEGLKLLEANSGALNGEGERSASASAPLPPPVPTASVSADELADAEDSDQMPVPDAATASAEEEQAPSHLMETSPTLPEMAFSQELPSAPSSGAPAPGTPAPAPAPAPATPSTSNEVAPAPAKPAAPAAPASPAAPAPAPKKKLSLRKRLCAKCKAGMCVVSCVCECVALGL